MSSSIEQIKQLLSILEPEVAKQQALITPLSTRLKHLREEVKQVERELGQLLSTYQPIIMEVKLAQQHIARLEREKVEAVQQPKSMEEEFDEDEDE